MAVIDYHVESRLKRWVPIMTALGFPNERACTQQPGTGPDYLTRIQQLAVPQTSQGLSDQI